MGYERWIEDGAPLETEPYPVDPDLRAKLLELHPKLGGWVYYDDDRRMVVFAHTAEFREEKIRLDAERQTRIREERSELKYRISSTRLWSAQRRRGVV